MRNAAKRRMFGTVCLIALLMIAFSVEWTCDILYVFPFTHWTTYVNNTGKVVKLRLETRPVRTGLPSLACEKTILKTNSTWFHEKFKIDINPLWTEDNINVDQQTYKWWMRIQRRKNDNLTEAIKELLATGVPRYSAGKPDDASCLRCAVVGSSDNLLEHKNAEEIDSHRYVIRFNSAMTEGYEKYVGTKTTHRIMYPESSMKKLHQNTSYVLAPFKPPDLRWMTAILGGRPYEFKSWASAPAKVECDASKVRVLHPAFMRYVHTDWLENKGSHPTTGLFGIILAIHLCDEVNIFGFGANSMGIWRHYYDKPGTGGLGKVHDVSAETVVIDRLAKENIVRVYR